MKKKALMSGGMDAAVTKQRWSLHRLSKLLRTKSAWMLILLLVIGTSAVFAQKVGDTVQVSGQNYRIDQVSGDTLVLKKAAAAETMTFTSIAAFKTWLDAQPNNTAAAPYNVKLNVSDLAGSSSATGSAGRVLTVNTNTSKYVNLDLSGSTFTVIPKNAFNSCKNLVGVTFPNKLTTIEDYVFEGCPLTTVTIPSSVSAIGFQGFNTNTLTSVTFQGTIPVKAFGSQSFPGKLNAKFYEKDKDNGTPGTYTRPNTSSDFTKQ